ncbi:MAG: glycosyltransferase [Comamonadaceae bacterium]|nr:glycosyltransferase [Comamonadaceae bacterium]
MGRAVDKKGYDDLLPALARLPASLGTGGFEHVGGGPELPGLREEARASRHRRARRRGSAPLAQPEVLARYRAADVFVLSSRVAEDGDRDGLPNVLMEAQSQRLPCVATAVSGIPELIEDGVTGLLVPPRGPGGARRRDRAARRRPCAARASGRGRTRAHVARLRARARHRPAGRALRRRRRDTMTGAAPVMRIASARRSSGPATRSLRATGCSRACSSRRSRRAGHDVVLASRLRAFEGRGDAARQARIAAVGAGLRAAPDPALATRRQRRARALVHLSRLSQGTRPPRAARRARARHSLRDRRSVDRPATARRRLAGRARGTRRPRSRTPTR